MRRPIIAGNWKMYKTVGETRAFFQKMLPEIRDVDHCDIVVAPPFTSLPAAVEEVKGKRVAISAQNLYWKEEGAFTGEVSSGIRSAASFSARPTRSWIKRCVRRSRLG